MKASVFFLLAILFVSAYATHFRYGTIAWVVEAPTSQPKVVTFTVNTAFRWSYTSGWYYPDPGAVASPGSFNFGDSSSVSLMSIVSSVFTADDWMTFNFGKGYGYSVSSPEPWFHTYSSATGSWVVIHQSCCRISSLSNNADTDWYISALVKLSNGAANFVRSPSTNSVPIITVPTGNSNYLYTLAASPGVTGNALSFTMATQAQVGGGNNPHPSGLSVNNAATGQMKFNTVGKNAGTLWTTQQIITETVSGIYIPLDYILFLQTPTTFCSNNPSQSCSTNADCPGGACVSAQPQVLYRNYSAVTGLYTSGNSNDTAVNRYTPYNGEILTLTIGKWYTIPLIAQDNVVTDPTKKVTIYASSTPPGGSLSTVTNCNSGSGCSCTANTASPTCNTPQLMVLTVKPTSAGSNTFCFGVRAYDNTELSYSQHCFVMRVTENQCGVGTGTPGNCVCPNGYNASTSCTDCNSGNYGASCTPCNCVNGQGDCSDGIFGDGTCTCLSGWSGVTCATPVNSVCTPNAPNSVVLSATNPSNPVNPSTIAATITSTTNPASASVTLTPSTTYRSDMVFLMDIGGGGSFPLTTQDLSNFNTLMSTFQGYPIPANAFVGIASVNYNGVYAAVSALSSTANRFTSLTVSGTPSTFDAIAALTSAVSDSNMGWRTTSYKVVYVVATHDLPTYTTSQIDTFRSTMLGKNTIPMFLLKNTAHLSGYNTFVSNLGFGYVNSITAADSSNWYIQANTTVTTSRLTQKLFVIGDTLGIVTLPGTTKTSAAFGTSVSSDAITFKAARTYTTAETTPTPTPSIVTLGWGVTSVVTSINRVPSGSAQSLSTNEDVALTFTLNAYDPDNNVMTFSIVTAPSKGVLSSSSGNPTSSLTFTPNANANGADFFTYTLNDGCLTSSAITVSINIIPVNDPPTCSNVVASVAESGQVTFNLNGADIDSASFNYVIDSVPTATIGALYAGSTIGTALTSGATVSSSQFTFKPVDYYNGAVTIQYHTVDASGASSANASVTYCTAVITVTPVNNAPTITVTPTDAKSSLSAPVGVTITVVVTTRDDVPLTLSWINNELPTPNAADNTLFATAFNIKRTAPSATTASDITGTTGGALVCNSAVAAYSTTTYSRSCTYSVFHTGGANYAPATDVKDITFSVADSRSLTATAFANISLVSDPPYPIVVSAGSGRQASAYAVSGGAYFYSADAGSEDTNILLRLAATTPDASSTTLVMTALSTNIYSASGAVVGTIVASSAVVDTVAGQTGTQYNITVRGASNYNGFATFNVKWAKAANPSSSVVVPVAFNITAVNDAPVLVSPPDVTMNENTPQVQTSSSMAFGNLVTDIDTAATNLNLCFTNVPSTSVGNLVRSDTNASITEGTCLSDATAGWGVRFYPALYQHSDASTVYAQFSLTANDGSANSNTVVQRIFVLNVNNAPYSQNGNTDTDSAKSVQITFTVGDQDSGDSHVVQITVPNTFCGQFCRDELCTDVPSEQFSTGFVNTTTDLKIWYQPPLVATAGCPTYSYIRTTARAYLTNFTFIPMETQANGLTSLNLQTPATYTYDISVAFVNQPPVFTGTTIRVVYEDSQNDILLRATDETSFVTSLRGFTGNGTLTFGGNVLDTNSISYPLNLSTEADILIFTPALNEYSQPEGSVYATVTIRFTDEGDPGTFNLSTVKYTEVTISFIVVPVDDAPVVTLTAANPGAAVPTSNLYITNEDTAVLVAWTATDVDNSTDQLTGNIFSPPSQGQIFAVNEDAAGNVVPFETAHGAELVRAAGSTKINVALSNQGPAIWKVWFLPRENAFGPIYDSFQVSANDSILESAPAVVLIRVIRINDPPVIANEEPALGLVNQTYVFSTINITDPDQPPRPMYYTYTRTAGTGKISLSNDNAFKSTTSNSGAVTAAPCTIDADNTTIVCASLRETTMNAYLANGITYITQTAESWNLTVFVSDLGNGNDPSNVTLKSPEYYLNATKVIEFAVRAPAGAKNSNALTYAGIGAAIGGVLAAIAAGIIIRNALKKTPDEYFSAFDNDGDTDVAVNPLYSDPFSSGQSQIYQPKEDGL